jgi:A/G-specific adenine glycosylase
VKGREITRVRSRLIRWYRRHHRRLPWRKTRDPYPIWVSEAMLQQTRVDTVIPYYRRFIRRFPDMTALAGADLQAVLKVWEGLGYYARARNLHRAVQYVVTALGGKVPDTWDPFRKLPGVGDYIAAAVLSMAFDRPFAVVDGNVKRVLARMFMIDAPVNRTGSHALFRETAERLLHRRTPGLFNQALMELGALVCTPRNPDCPGCPLAALCLARQARQTDRYPKREKAKPVPEYPVAAGVIFKKGKILITRRRTDVMLGGLWEFPGGKVRPGETPAEACIREIREEVGLTVAIEGPLARVRHAYTHFKIDMHVFRCRYRSGRVALKGPVDFRWITIRQIDDFPFPGANRKFIPLITP